MIKMIKSESTVIRDQVTYIYYYNTNLMIMSMKNKMNNSSKQLLMK